MPTASGHTSAIRASKVKGTSVYNTAGDKIGHVEDVILDKQTERVLSAAIGFGGLFGMGEKYAPVPWSMLNYNEDKGGYVVPLSEDIIKAVPARRSGVCLFARRLLRSCMGHDGAGGIAAYYDNLLRFLDVARRVGRGGGAPYGSTHRFLAGEEGDQTSPERLDWLVLDAAMAAGLPSAPNVLDAGCGVGGTIFRWHERVGGQYDGLTLSPEQQRRAQTEAVRRGAVGACRFHLRSYHDPLGGLCDAAIAIESLAHSPDPAAAVANIAAALSPGGLLLIVDDMPEGAEEPRTLAAFKTRWRCPVLLSTEQYGDVIMAAGLDLRHAVDLTPRLRPRPLWWLRVLIAAFGLARALAPAPWLKDALGAIQGGFYLEALYRRRAMRYRLLVAQART